MKATPTRAYRRRTRRTRSPALASTSRGSRRSKAWSTASHPSPARKSATPPATPAGSGIYPVRPERPALSVPFPANMAKTAGAGRHERKSSLSLRMPLKEATRPARLASRSLLRQNHSMTSTTVSATRCAVISMRVMLRSSSVCTSCGTKSSLHEVTSRSVWHCVSESAGAGWLPGHPPEWRPPEVDHQFSDPASHHHSGA